MDLTPLVPCSALPSVPCDLYIATVFLPSRLIIRSSNSLSIKRVIGLETSFASNISHMKWHRSSNDGHRRILLADTKEVRAYDMDDDQWELCITEGLGGVRHVDWSSAGDEILVWSEFQLKMTVWPLFQQQGKIIPNPKFTNKAYGFRPQNPDHFALLQRTSHDQVIILDTKDSSWHTIHTFAVETSDAQGLQWSPDGKWLAIWDSAVDYKVLIYTCDGRLLKTYSAYEIGLGVKTVQWSPDGDYLAIGSYDNKVRLLNNLTFSPVIHLSHTSTIKSENTAVWRQVTTNSVMRYDLADQPISPPQMKSMTNEVNPKLGVGVLSFSPDGAFIATRSDNMPTTLWIWSLREMSPIAVLIHAHIIKTVQWHPHEVGQIVLTCQSDSILQNNAIYLWSIEWTQPRIISIPRDGFDVKWFRFVENTEGERENAVLIGSGDCFTLGYPCHESERADGTIMEEQEEEDQTEDDDETIRHDESTASIREHLQSSVLLHSGAPENSFKHLGAAAIEVL